MINRITVSEKRGLFPEYSNLGTIGEKNATTLLFLLPAALQGYNENIVCVTSQGSFTYMVSNNTFNLPSEVLTDNTLDLQLILKDGDNVIWKSIPYTFTLNPTLDDSGIHDGQGGLIAVPATAETLGLIKVGENLKITEDGVLSVDTANVVEQDNTKPITSAAVHTEIGNIEVLLAAL